MHALIGPVHPWAPHVMPPTHTGMQMTASSDNASQMSSGDHCAVLGHHCVSLRAIDFPAVEPAILPILLFAMLLFAMAALVSPGVRTLGRPPPWAIRDHLCLGVIRC